MSVDPDKFAEAVQLLKDSSAKKRESGAKRLGKLGDAAAGPYLVEALKQEGFQVKTWMVQLKMIEAIGHCLYRDGAPFLWELAGQATEAGKLYIYLGEALVRLENQGVDDISTIERIIEMRNYLLTDGALFGMSQLQLVPSQEQIGRLIAVAEDPAAVEATAGYPGCPRGLRTWVAVAAGQWSGAAVKAFLERCLAIPDDYLQSVAQKSLAQQADRSA